MLKVMIVIVYFSSGITVVEKTSINNGCAEVAAKIVRQMKTDKPKMVYCTKDWIWK